METIYLVGAEEVTRAGQNIRGAAEEISRALSANNLEWVLEKNQRHMDNWLTRFEDVVSRITVSPAEPPAALESRE